MFEIDSEKIDEAVVDLGRVDYLDLWAICRLLEAEFGARAATKSAELALEAVERLLQQGRLRAGDLVPPGEFVPWPHDPATAIGIIRKRFEALDHTLGVGDVAWFEVPEAEE